MALFFPRPAPSWPAEPFRIITGAPDRSTGAARRAHRCRNSSPRSGLGKPRGARGRGHALGQIPHARCPGRRGKRPARRIRARCAAAAVSALLGDLARIPPTAAIGLVGALGDEDAEIRRLVSFSLPIIVSHMRHFAMLNRQFPAFRLRSERTPAEPSSSRPTPRMKTCR